MTMTVVKWPPWQLSCHNHNWHGQLPYCQLRLWYEMQLCQLSHLYDSYDCDMITVMKEIWQLSCWRFDNCHSGVMTPVMVKSNDSCHIFTMTPWQLSKNCQNPKNLPCIFFETLDSSDHFSTNKTQINVKPWSRDTTFSTILFNF